MLDISTVLGQILKLNEEEIRTALTLTKDYKVVKVPKKSGGYRILYIPPESLKKVQRKILKCLFRKIWKTHQVGLYGIYRGTSYVQHAQEHKKAKWVFQFDLSNAFSSVNVLSLREIISRRIEDEMGHFEISLSNYRNMLEQKRIMDEEIDVAGRGDMLFDEFKYLRKEKREVINSAFFPLQDLMVKEKEDKRFTFWAFPQRKEIAQGLTDLIMALTTFRGILPQGTPTAPFLFYLALAEGDLFAELKSLFPIMLPESQDRYQFRVSAYIDNFVISAQKPIPPRNQEELFKTVEKFGFKINLRKIRQQGMIFGAPLITGLRVTNDKGEGKVVLPKRKIRQWRGLIHRAIFEPDLRPKVNGLIASLKPIYGTRRIIDGNYFTMHGKFPQEPVLPSQLKKPYQKFLQAINKI
jgi:hypothetical protein